MSRHIACLIATPVALSAIAAATTASAGPEHARLPRCVAPGMSR